MKKSILIIGILLMTCISTLAIVFGLNSSDILGTNKRPLTISTVSAEKTYDGTPLSAEGYEITDGTLKKGHTMTVKYVNSLTEVGTVPNAISVNIIDSEDVNVTSDYDITYNLGSLAVIARDITISSDTVKKTYDGKEVDYKKADISAGSLADGQKIQYSFEKYVERIGETQNTFTATISTEDGNDVTHNYNINYVYGDIVLSTCIMAIRTDTLSKNFDGEALTSDNYEIVSGTLPDGLEIVIDYNPEITYVSKVENEFELRIVNSLTQEDVSEFFDMSYLNGYLEITKRPITINIPSKSKEYDGTPLESKDITPVSGSLPDNGNYKFVVVSNPSITEVGTIDNDVIVEIHKKSNNEDVTKYFDLVYSTGTLTVKKCEIHIKTPSEEKTYDGIDLTNDNYEVINDLPTGYVLDIINLPKVEGVPEDGVENKITFRVLKDGTEDDYSRFFNIIYDDIGILKVNKLELAISTDNISRKYNGQPLYDNNLNITPGTLPTGFSLKYDKDNTPRITDVGEILNDIEYTVVYNNGETETDVTKYCDIYENIGKIVVKKRDIDITTPSITKTYDGNPVEQTIGDLTITSGSLVDGEEFVIKTPNNIEVNTAGYSNIIDISIKRTQDGIDTTENYDINIVYGTNIINPRKLNLKTGSASQKYDGNYIKNDIIPEITGGDGLLEGDRIVVLSAPSIKDAKTIDNKYDVNIYRTETYIDENGDEKTKDVNVTNHYKITMSYGTLSIQKRCITISSLSANKDYDNTFLTYHYYELSDTTPLAENEEITDVTFSPNASIKKVGSVDNTIANVVIKNTETGEETTTNYTISYDFGTLTINRVYSTVTSNGTLSSDGGFGLPDGDIETVEVAKIVTETTGSVYLKSYNYKDISYVGGQWIWDSPNAYDSKIYDLSADYLTGIALLYSGATYTNIQITESQNYVLPYYLTDNTDGYTKQTSDVKYSGTDKDYSVWVGGLRLDKLANYSYGDSSVVTFEQAYRTYVYDTYKHVNDATKTFLENLISENDLSDCYYSADMTDAEYATAIRKIVNFIKSSATYDLNYDRTIDSTSTEPTIAFFVTGEGICQHFALAGTMLLRTLGYPARYTVGFVANTVANVETTVTSENAHAWVEVYHDGLGWIQIETTGVATSDVIITPEPDAIIVRPKDISVPYTSTLPLTWDSVYSASVNADGYYPCTAGIVVDSAYTTGDYYYKATIIGTQSGVGASNSEITSFTLYKKVGDNYEQQDVKFNFQTGKLQVYYDTITITTAGSSKVYDGTALVNNGASAITGIYGESDTDIGTPYESNGNIHKYNITLISGIDESSTFTLIITVTGSQSSVGRTQNTCSVQIFTAEGRDVTARYNIVKNMGYLKVSKIALTITAGSATGTYVEGSTDVLTCDDYTPTGTLLDGDKLHVIIESSMSLGETGTVLNEVSSAYVTRDGDVVDYYNISTEPGYLTVS